jgi:hypothetical protein
MEKIMSDATTRDLVRWGFRQIGTIAWSEATGMTVTVTDRSVESGIYAFVLGEVLCRIGTKETDLVGRVVKRGRLVTESYQGRHPKGFSREEAARWIERCRQFPTGGSVWAREGTSFHSPVGPIGAMDGAYAEESHIIRSHRPRMNLGRN